MSCRRVRQPAVARDGVPRLLETNRTRTRGRLLETFPTLLRRTAMFTGLVEAMGRVVRLADDPPGKRLSIDAGPLAEDARLGDSIAINGCCLTVVAIDENRLDFEAGEETLSRTNLGELHAEARVNLERSLAAGDRLGGHYVTGHVDAVARLLERRDDPPWAHLRFELPAELASQVAAQGSIAIDGISLTVVEAGAESFTVALIPHTLDVTTLGGRRVGDRVNLETDLLAKYVQRSIAFASSDPSRSADSARNRPAS